MRSATAAPRPGGSFAEAAVRLAGLSGVLFGWTPEAFWDATPADVAAVLAAWRADDEAAGVDRAGLAMMMEQCPDG